MSCVFFFASNLQASKISHKKKEKKRIDPVVLLSFIESVNEAKVVSLKGNLIVAKI